MKRGCYGVSKCTHDLAGSFELPGWSAFNPIIHAFNQSVSSILILNNICYEFIVSSLDCVNNWITTIFIYILI